MERFFPRETNGGWHAYITFVRLIYCKNTFFRLIGKAHLLRKCCSVLSLLRLVGADDVVHRGIVWGEWDFFEALRWEANAYETGMLLAESGDEPVVIAFAASHAVTMAVEGKSGNHDEIYYFRFVQYGSHGFHDAKGAALQVGFRGIGVYFHLCGTDYGWEIDVLLCGAPSDEGVGGWLVGEGMEKKHIPCFLEGGMCFNFLHNPFAPFCFLRCAECRERVLYALAEAFLFFV